jgi:outer membrane protein TolC
VIISCVRGCALVALVSFFAATASFAQTESSSPGAQTRSAPNVTIPSQQLASSQSQNPFSGSVPMGKATTDMLPLSLQGAIDRGLKQNLGLLLTGEGIRAARGQRWEELSELLPNVTTATSANVEQLAIKAQNGFRFPIPGIPAVVGPFGYFDTRARLTQTVFNWKFIEQVRSDAEQVHAADRSYADARELVVLVVGSAYLQTIADAARVDTAAAQRETAQALFQQASDELRAGTIAAIDALRAQVELQTRVQQLIVARNALAKQKLVLARIIGLPLGQEFLLTDKPAFAPLTQTSLDEALRRAYASRPDYQSAFAQLRAAELARKAATAGSYPTVSVSADYGLIGITPESTHGTVDASATLRFPIFEGGKVHGDVLRAEAALRQSRQQLENLRGQIDQEVRDAFLDLQAASDQVAVARSSVDLSNQTLQQARDRFAAGVTDNIEVVQAQESVASANESLISSLYSYNLAKIQLARSIGFAEAGVQEYLKGK